MSDGREVTSQPGDAETQPTGLDPSALLVVEVRGVKWRVRMLSYGEFLALREKLLALDAKRIAARALQESGSDGAGAAISEWAEGWDAWVRQTISDCVVGWGDTEATLEGDNLDRVLMADGGMAATELANAILEKQGSDEALWAGFR